MYALFENCFQAHEIKNKQNNSLTRQVFNIMLLESDPRCFVNGVRTGGGAWACMRTHKARRIKFRHR